MFCKQCGTTLEEHAVFCPNCGTPTNDASNNNAKETMNNTNNADQHKDTPQTGNQVNYQQQNTNPNIYNQPRPNNYTQPQQSNYNNWQQSPNPNQYSNYPQNPMTPRKNNQNTIIIAIIAIVVVAGLIFGAVKLFSGSGSGSSDSGSSSGVSSNKTKTIKDLVVGTWDGYEVDQKTSSTTIKFLKNGQCTIDESSDSYKGNYTIDDSDKNNIKIDFDLTDSEGDSNTLSVYVKKVNDDKLKLIREDDTSEEDPLTLVRQK